MRTGLIEHFLCLDPAPRVEWTGPLVSVYAKQIVITEAVQ